MTQPEIIQTAQTFYEIFGAIIVSGVGTSIAVEILKSKYIPVQFQKYPRLTATVAALIASIIAVYNSPIQTISIDTPIEWVGVVAGVLIVASITYNNIFKGSGQSYR